MPDKLYLVFQDCYKCGTKEHWAWLQEQYAKDAGIELVKMPFYRTGADALIKRAAENGYNVPFITDTSKFAYSVKNLLDELREAENKNTPKKAKKTKKKATKKSEVVDVEVDDGDNQ